MADKESKERKLGKSIRAQGLALAIPMVLVSFPLIAGFVGKYLAGRFEKPWITVVFIVLGFALGIKECLRMLNQLNKMNK